MASLCTYDNNTKHRIVFTGPDGKRKTIWLGTLNKSLCQTTHRMVQKLVQAKIVDEAPPDQVTRWLVGISPALMGKLIRAGLVDERPEAPKHPLGAFIDSYIAGRANLKPNTLRNFQQSRRLLVEHFGADRDLTSITPAEAKAYREGMIREGRARSYMGREVRRARQFFTDAVDQQLIATNPFAGIDGSMPVNKSRERFIEREAVDLVLNKCPDQEWRCIVALARYGGLRCPSEVLALRWDDIDWQRERMRVRSPKTEHIEGRESRFVPLFPELLPELRDAQELAPEGAEFVITRYRSGANLRTQLHRIAKRAGQEEWPKPFHNMRATRATELMDDFPSHVVTAWLGHTEVIAEKHYLQVTEKHFARAVAASASHNPARHRAEKGEMSGK
jgi:integrase